MQRAWAAALSVCITLWLWVPVTRAAANQTLDDTSFGWLFQPPVCAVSCDGSLPNIPRAWWQLSNLREPKFLTDFHAGTETATNLVGASATLQFHGTDIWYFGSRSPTGGIMNITLDDDVTQVNSILPEGSRPVRQQLLWSAHNLDPKVQHTLKITMAGGVIIDVDRVDITLPEADAPTTTNPTTDPSSSQATSNSSPKGLGLAAIIVGVVCGVLLIATIAFALWYCSRKRRQEHEYAPAVRELSNEDLDMLSKPLPLAPSNPSSSHGHSHEHSQGYSQGHSHNQSVGMVSSRETGSSHAVHATDGSTSMELAMSQTTTTQSSSSGPSQDPSPTLRSGPTRHDGLLRYALVRTASMRPTTVLIEGQEPDPLSATSGSELTPRPGPMPTPVTAFPGQSTTDSPTANTSSDLMFTPHRDSQASHLSSEIDHVALAIRRDQWPQPPSFIPAPSPISPEGTITVGMMRSPTHMQRLYAAAYPAPSQELPTSSQEFPTPLQDLPAPVFELERHPYANAVHMPVPQSPDTPRPRQ